MKLLLTSAGVKNQSIHDALVDLVGKPISESHALCIPTASYGHVGGQDRAFRFITGTATTPMTDLGWKSLGVLELTTLPTLPKGHWVPAVQECDVLLVNGGDPMYLYYWIRESGLADLLPSLHETLWVGLSAGSMVMAPNIGVDFVSWQMPHRGDETLGIVDLRCFPIWITRPCRRTPWRTRRSGPRACRSRVTRWTMRPPSECSTAPSTSSPRGIGNC